jgi:hypothetical protein
MIEAVLAVSLTLLLGMVCSVFAQSDDMASVLDKAQKSLDTQQSESESVDKDETTLSEGFKVYESKQYGIKMQYPSDWDSSEETGPVDYSPDMIFVATFTSPSNKESLDTAFSSFQIDKLLSPTTLEQHKKKRIEEYIADRPNVKDVVHSDIMLSGRPAFRTDYIWTDNSNKYIFVETITDDRHYTLAFVGEPDTFDKHITSIEKMIKSAEITPTVATNTQSSESTSSNPSTSTNSPKSSTPQSDKQDDCDSSYPDFCIPPAPPNLNCPDIPQKRFTVTGSDPHGFDRDNDSIGCES